MQVYELKDLPEKIRYSTVKIKGWIKEKRLKKGRHYYKPGRGANSKLLFTDEQIKNILEDLTGAGK